MSLQYDHKSLTIKILYLILAIVLSNFPLQIYPNILLFKAFNQLICYAQNYTPKSKDLSLDFIHFPLCLPVKIIFHSTDKVSLPFVKGLLNHQCITFASKSLSLNTHCHRLP